jgi:hypothetical protein
MRKVTKDQKRDIRAIAAKRDEDIDFSDAPPDSDVIAWLKADGRGYQTKANWLLRNAMLHFRKEVSMSRRKIRSRHGKARQGKGKG